MRDGKGKSLIEFLDDYCIVDVETTGLDYDFCQIIEISSLKVRNGQVVDSFSMLVNPGKCQVYDFQKNEFVLTPNYIPSFVQEMTGITDEMVENEPAIDSVIKNFYNFVGNDVLVGHNIVSFDSNFLFDALQKYTGEILSNNLVDTMRISRWVLPDLKHRRLEDLAQYYKIPVIRSHRGLPDCQTTFHVYTQLKESCLKKNGNLDSFYSYVKSHLNKSFFALRSKDIVTDKTNFDISNPIYGSVCVFTGTLEKMTRREAMQIVKDLGGENGDSVTKKTNFLILGNNDFCKTIKDGKSSKQKKAEKLILEGNDIKIISENVFYEMANI